MAGGGEWCILLHYRQPKLVLYNRCNAGEGFPYYWEGKGGLSVEGMEAGEGWE